MWKFCAAIVMLAAVNGPAHAASAVNLDSEPHTLIVTEGGSKSELAVAAGETVEFCPTRLLRDAAEWRPRSAERLGDHRDLRRPGQDQVAEQTACIPRRPAHCPAFYLFR